MFRKMRWKYYLPKHSRNYSIDVKSFQEIPSAKGLPYVGTLFSLINSGGAKNLHRYIDRRHQEFGPIFLEKLGPITSLFLNDADEIRKVFMHEGRYPKHVLPECWLLYNKVKKYERGLYFMDREEWFTHRKLLNDMLLKRDYYSEAEKNAVFVEDMLSRWLDCSNDGKVINLEDELYNLSLIFMMSFVFGNRFHENTNIFLPRIHQLSDIVKDIFEYSVKLSMLPATLAMRLNLKIWNGFVNAVDQSVQITRELLHDAIQLYKEDINDESILQFLLKRNLGTDLIERILVDFILAAGDTTAYTMLWTFYLLGRHKDVQDKLFVDIVESKGKNEQSPAIRNVIKESMRLYPIAPFIARYLPEETSICGYRIPANQLISLSMYNSSRNEKYFPNADQFQPSRWQRLENGKYASVIDPYATLPFAMGARSCIGRNLSKAQLFFTIDKIISSFEIESLNEVDVKLNLITLPSQPVHLHLRRR
ncbi:cytochrome P450 315a1, mitochondrial [Planococcus citri]|uniref:cytochrome P450 315a1, mitochondrial n=1 Tax=Planococcus citri TaxID=170843 RepID=UPI0031F86609